MSLTEQIANLNDVQIHSLHNTLLDACTAMELGGNWREVFRRAKQRHIGLMKRIYELLHQAQPDDIDRAANHLTAVLQHIPSKTS
jgi:hypothetical protein